jgi:tRNA (guanine37-N1)-methyltransferase
VGSRVIKASCLKVPKAYGEKAIVLIRELDLLNQEFKIQQIGNLLHIPLISEPQKIDIEKFGKNLPEFEVSVCKFLMRTKRPLKLVDVLEDKLAPHLLASLPHAIDFVGNIAIIEVPQELEPYKNVLGEAILNVHKRVHTVLAKSGAVGGVFRVRDFEVIAGTGKTETVHKEYNCTYYVDLRKAYFSPRLSHEHDRVASQVKEGETVVDMFAGVGSFSILIAKKRDKVQVYAIDVNPDAIEFLKKNIEVNRVSGKVKPILGDARKVIEEQLVGVADRIIMNLPEKAIEYVDVACKAIKPEGGVIHFYSFTDAPNPLETTKIRLIEAVKQTNRSVKKIPLTRRVKATAPYEWQVVVDAEIQ